MEFQEYIIVSLINMGLTHSTRRNRFKTYRFLARNLTPVSETGLLKEAFCGLPGTKLPKLKKLHSEIFTKIDWGRLIVFSNFAVQLIRPNGGGMGTTV